MMKSTNSASGISAARWSSIQGVVGILLQFATIAMLARLLEPEVFGSMAILVVIQGIATMFAQMGLSSAIVQKAKLSSSALNSLYWLNVGLGVVVTLVLLIIAPFVSSIFGMPELCATTRVFSATFLISCWSIQFQALAQKYLQLRRIALINMASLFVAGIVSVVLAWRGLELWALVWGVLAASAVRSLSFFITGVRDHGRPKWYFNWQDSRELVVFGAHRFGAMLANAVNSRIDQLLIGGMLGAQALGFYSMATGIVLQPAELTNPVVTRVAFPWLSRIQDDSQKLNETYLEIVGLVVAVNAPILVAAAVLAEWYVPLLLGDGWEPVVTLIPFLAGYALLRSIINAGGSLILAKGRADWTMYWNIVLLIVFPITLYLAARHGDLGTLALTLTCLQLVVVFLYHRFLIQPLTGIKLSRFLAALAWPILNSFVAGFAAYATLYLIDRSGNFTNTLMGVIVGGIVYVILSHLLLPRQVEVLRKIVFANSSQDEKD